jgi:hypothetical protein
VLVKLGFAVSKVPLSPFTVDVPAAAENAGSAGGFIAFG